MSTRMEDDGPRCATCPECGAEAEWRDIEGHPDGGEWYCPLGCVVAARREVELAEAVDIFIERLVSESRDLDPEIGRALNEHFWDVYEPI